MSRLTRDGTTESVSRDQILRRERGQGNIHFSCSADHEQDWQPYPVDPYSCYMCDDTYIHTFSHSKCTSGFGITYQRGTSGGIFLFRGFCGHTTPVKQRTGGLCQVEQSYVEVHVCVGFPGHKNSSPSLRLKQTMLLLATQ